MPSKVPISQPVQNGHSDGRPWWRKKRFAIPTTAVAGLILIGALGDPPEEDEIAQAEQSESVDAEVTTTVDTGNDADEAEPASKSSVQPTTAPSTQAPDPPSMATPLERPVSGDEVAIALEALDAAVIVDELQAPVPYRRAEYSEGWGDADGDCFSDRHEILLERSEAPTEVDDCQVATGQWTDPYDGEVYTDARTITIDHFVPLSAAHRAGAWAWDSDTKAAFAADITYRQSHVPAGQETNEEKGDKEPHEWRPENQDAWCGYALDWVSVKTRWALAFSSAEQTAVREMLQTCEASDDAAAPATTIPLASPIESTTTSSTTTTIAITEGAAEVEISWCRAREETVQVINVGGELITLNGWILHDERRNHETRLDRISLAPGQRVVMLSGEDTLDVADTFRWANNNVWNNDGDTATLLNSDGFVIGEERCS